MRIIRADAMGMCFGVKSALEKVWALGYVNDTALYGELVHNAEINRRLAARGIQLLNERDRSPDVPFPCVVISAHGVCDRERQALVERGKEIIDTTCPLVKRAHRAAKVLDQNGYFVVVLGKKDHVEVKGLTGDLSRYVVVENAEQVETYPYDRIGLVCQTTTSLETLDAVWTRLVRRNFGKEMRLLDTICGPTRDRQKAVLRRTNQGIQALVVVGGRNSNNTALLATIAEKQGIKTFRVETASDLDPAWFAGMETVGLTAGTSALDSTIDAVERALQAMGRTANLRRVS